MTSNSGTFFHPKQSTSTKNKVSTVNNKVNKRSSIYASSDSSDDIVRGELRRGSAPVTHDMLNERDSVAFLQTTGNRQKKRQKSNAYVFTSDDSSGEEDSDSDNSADFNARAADFYQPASHLRKAVAQTAKRSAKLSSKVGATAGGVVKSNNGNGATGFSHARNKSTGRRDTSSNQNKRNQSKSNTRAKHGIQSI